MIYFFIGPMGVGKSYCAKRFAERSNLQFVEGDTFVPPEMLDKVIKFQALSQDDIDNYVRDNLIPGIEHYLGDKDLVVAQALYRAKNRDEIRHYFGSRGHQCQFVLVKAPWLTNLKRLWSRPNGFRWMLYGIKNSFFFQSKGVDKVVANP